VWHHLLLQARTIPEDLALVVLPELERLLRRKLRLPEPRQGGDGDASSSGKGEQKAGAGSGRQEPVVDARISSSSIGLRISSAAVPELEDAEQGAAPPAAQPQQPQPASAALEPEPTTAELLQLLLDKWPGLLSTGEFADAVPAVKVAPGLYLNARELQRLLCKVAAAKGVRDSKLLAAIAGRAGPSYVKVPATEVSHGASFEAVATAMSAAERIMQVCVCGGGGAAALLPCWAAALPRCSGAAAGEPVQQVSAPRAAPARRFPN
jgi:hypothetical protein